MSDGNVSRKSWSSAFEGLRWKADTCTRFITKEHLFRSSIQTHDFCTQQKVSELWDKVIMRKDPEAMVTLGHVYMRGFEGFPCKYSQALELFCRAADANNAEAFVALMRFFKTAKNKIMKHNELVERLSKATENKNPGAMFCLGVLYDMGYWWGVPEDQDRARELISEAASLGNSCAMLWMGRNFAKSHEEAISWFEKALSAGNHGGYFMLGEYYFKIHEVDAALEAYRKGADLGDLGSIVELAYLFEQGIDVPKDEAKAIELYQKAAALGFRSKLFEIASLHEMADQCKQAVAVYEKALGYEENAQAVEKMHFLASLYYRGGSDLPTDGRKGYQWLSEAAYLQYPPALFDLVEKTERGQGCPKDRREAQRLKRLYDGVICKDCQREREKAQTFGLLYAQRKSSAL